MRTLRACARGALSAFALVVLAGAAGVPSQATAQSQAPQPAQHAGTVAAQADAVAAAADRSAADVIARSTDADTDAGTADASAIPALTRRVTDQTGTLDAGFVQALDGKLAALEAEKGAQIAVLMVPTTGTDSIEQYAVRVFEQWQLGRKDVDDGILLVLATQDRTLRIEVGYGLEGAVTDVQANRIINETIVPRLKQGDFAGGVAAGVDALVGLVNGEILPPAPTIRSVPAPSARQDVAGLARHIPGEVFMIGAAFLLAMPPWLAALGAALLAYLFTGWIIAALLGGGVGFMLALAMKYQRANGVGAHRASRGGYVGGLASTRGWSSRGGAGGFGGGGGFGGFSGGGGRSGGGGASGRW